MPKVQQYGLRTVTPSPAATPYQDINAPAAAFGANAWETARDLSNTVMRAADLIGRDIEDMNQRANETAAIDLDNQFSSQLLDLSSKYRGLTGKAAYDGYAAYKQEVENLKKSIGDTAGNSEVGSLFSRAANTRILSALDQGMAHRDREFKVYETSVSAGRIENALNTAIADPYNSENFNLNRDVAIREQSEMMRRDGKSEEEITAAGRTLASKFARAAIEQAASYDPFQARMLLDGSGPKIGQSFKAKVSGAESSDDYGAKNPNSSATGKYQITKGTWESLGFDWKDIGNPELQEQAMDMLTARNAAEMQQALGRVPNDTEMYLAHRFGTSGATQLLNAPIDDDISKHVSKQVMEANPDLKGLSVGDLVTETARKFGTGTTWVGQEPRVASLKGSMTTDDLVGATRFLEGQEREARTNYRVSVDQRYDDQRAAALRGELDPVSAMSRDEIGRAYEPEIADQKYKQLQHDIRLGDQVQAMRFASNDDLEKAAKAPAPSYEGEGYAQAAADHDATTEAAQRILQQRREDPAGYVLSVSPDIVDEMGTAETRDQAIAKSLSMQSRMGIAKQDQRALSNQQAADAIESIRSAGTPDGQLTALFGFVGQGSEVQRKKITEDLMRVKGGLPAATPLILDLASVPEQQATAKRIWSELLSPTEGISLDTAGKNEVISQSQSGLGEVLQQQQLVTGSAAYAKQWQDYAGALTQIAKVRGAAMNDYQTAAAQGANDLSGNLSFINDDTLAHVYYPKSYEAKTPGAIEAGLNASRSVDPAELQSRFDVSTLEPGARALFEKQSADAADYIANNAVWVNSGDGFALIVPGTDPSTPGPGVFKRMSYEDVYKAGAKVMDRGGGQGLLARPQKAWPFNTPAPERVE